MYFDYLWWFWLIGEIIISNVFLLVYIEHCNLFNRFVSNYVKCGSSISSQNIAASTWRVRGIFPNNAKILWTRKNLFVVTANREGILWGDRSPKKRFLKDSWGHFVAGVLSDVGARSGWPVQWRCPRIDDIPDMSCKSILLSDQETCPPHAAPHNIFHFRRFFSSAADLHRSNGPAVVQVHGTLANSSQPSPQITSICDGERYRCDENELHCRYIEKKRRWLFPQQLPIYTQR